MKVKVFVFLILCASDHQIKVMGRYNEELPTALVYYQTRVYSKLKKKDFLLSQYLIPLRSKVKQDETIENK